MPPSIISCVKVLRRKDQMLCNLAFQDLFNDSDEPVYDSPLPSIVVPNSIMSTGVTVHDNSINLLDTPILIDKTPPDSNPEHHSQSNYSDLLDPTDDPCIIDIDMDMTREDSPGGHS